MRAGQIAPPYLCGPARETARATARAVRAQTQTRTATDEHLGRLVELPARRRRELGTVARASAPRAARRRVGLAQHARAVERSIEAARERVH